MAVPKAKKKSRNPPVKDNLKFKKIHESTWLCLATAIEQLYEDCGWRVKRINRLVDGYLNEMHSIYDRFLTPIQVAKESEKVLHDEYVSLTSRFEPYRQDCYNLCIGCLVKTLKKLGVSITRIKLIIGTIFYYKRNYELYSVYNSVADLTGFDVRVQIAN